ncbi:nucleotide exchange factor GrpE, partial [Dehalococcoidia bacterium]|nr:nucleotide exchange factor GrpE [Dehalococcoidia bacterium]
MQKEYSMDNWKSLVLQDFQHWLENLSQDVIAYDDAAEVACDWHTLLAEFTALRQEIRLQNREQVKVLRDLATVAEVGETTIDLFRRHTEELSGLEERSRQAAERRCLLSFLDVRDALVRGRDAAARVAASRGLFRRPPRGIEEVVQGYEMAIERFDRALAQAGVRLIETVGRIFDAEQMRAVGTRTVNSVTDGVVVEEFFSGFVHGDEVLRLAEVVVNRHQDGKG